MKSPGGGKALFEHSIVEGQNQNFRLQSTMGSRRRMALALQVADVADIAQEIQLIPQSKTANRPREGWSLLKQGIHLAHARPKSVREAPCQKSHKLGNAEAFLCGSSDSQMLAKRWRRFITLPMCIRAIRRQARATSAFIGCV
jgi:3-polyprenyl-4-hydroxybenzoate decarboxylase